MIQLLPRQWPRIEPHPTGGSIYWRHAAPALEFAAKVAAGPTSTLPFVLLNSHVNPVRRPPRSTHQNLLALTSPTQNTSPLERAFRRNDCVAHSVLRGVS